MMKGVPLTLVRRYDTHRLVPSRHSRAGDSVLTRIADDDEHLQAIFELDAATNDRLLAAHQRFPGIGVEELVSGVPHAHVINAAFCHPHPLGARFSGPERGAWYGAFALETAQAEVAFHKSVQLAETNWTDDESVTYDDYLADFSAEFHESAPGSRVSRLSRSGQLRRVAGARRAAAGRRLPRRGVSERAPSRHVRGLFPAGAGDERAARGDVSFHLARRREGADRVPRRYLITPAHAQPVRQQRRPRRQRRVVVREPDAVRPLLEDVHLGGTPALRRAR